MRGGARQVVQVPVAYMITWIFISIRHSFKYDFGDDIKLFVAGTLAILIISLPFLNYINFHNGVET